MGVDNRRDFRYARQLAVDIDGLVVYTVNVSLRGLQLECPGMRMLGFESAVKESRLALNIRIPPGRDLPVTGRVAYTSPYNDDFLIGIELLSFEPQGAAYWRRYIESLSDTPPID
jgi:hypothetical protein